MNDENKIVIFDWGGIVSSHHKDEYNCYTSRIDTINRLNEKTKKLDRRSRVYGTYLFR